MLGNKNISFIHQLIVLQIKTFGMQQEIEKANG